MSKFIRMLHILRHCIIVVILSCEGILLLFKRPALSYKSGNLLPLVFILSALPPILFLGFCKLKKLFFSL